ncbi:MAG: carboxypeptidase-like regulatory domain-containing protein [Bacteroidota bacterium]
MKFKLTIVFLLVAFFTNAQLQIEGKVIDSVTHKPLAAVNVFLSHTTIGINSNEKGEFQFSNLKQEKYELVVSSLNYEQYIIPISVNQNSDPLLIKLKPTANILKEVIVEPFDKNGWDQWGEKFKLYFIGSTQLAKNCKLLNPEVVKFRFNSKTNKLRAFANEILIFENKSLGYKIKYLLSKFEIDFTNNNFSFKGYPLFEELKTNKIKEATKWNLQRNEIYKGSIRHFMRSLYFNQLENEGFEIREVRIINDEEKNRIHELVKSIQEKVDAGNGAQLQIDNDSLDYYNKVNNISYGENKVTLSKLITRDSFVFNTNSSMDPISRSVYFEGIFQVIYLNKKMPYEYVMAVPHLSADEKVRTDIYLRPYKSISIYPNGSYFSGLDLLTDGYWSWSEKVATMMPIEYIPIPK